MSIFQTGAPGTNERLISLATTNNPVAYESIRSMDLGYDLSREVKGNHLMIFMNLIPYQLFVL